MMNLNLKKLVFFLFLSVGLYDFSYSNDSINKNSGKQKNSLSKIISKIKQNPVISAGMLIVGMGIGFGSGMLVLKLNKTVLSSSKFIKYNEDHEFKVQGDIPQCNAPFISELKWGTATVIEPNGDKKVYIKHEKLPDDIILLPTGSKKWDWTIDKTNHNPGIKLEALVALKDCEIIIISRGMTRTLLTTDEVASELNKAKIDFCILQSIVAAKTYNALVSNGKKVGMLLHLTC